MRRLTATFEHAAAAAAAGAALDDAGLEPVVPEPANPFFDPTVRVPEARGWLWGGLAGGVLGVVLLVALDQFVIWIPRVSPVMTAGPWALGFLGFGLGVAAGGFVGGVVGTAVELTVEDRPRLAVTVPDHRVDEVTDLLRAHGATAVEGVVTHHEHPLQVEAIDART